jgi:hypothetical protein
MLDQACTHLRDIAIVDGKNLVANVNAAALCCKTSFNYMRDEASSS